MNAKVLVTGGAGFVGSSLVRRLLESNYEVVVLDNLARGSIENLPSSDGLTFVEGDIRSDADVAQAMSQSPDSVVHLAAQHFIPYCNEHPGDTIHVNVYGTQVVLNAARRSGKVSKFVFASTAAVYSPGEQAHKEDETRGPIDIYGVSKKIGEDLVNFFGTESGITTFNARLFNVVGPRETNPHLLPDIIDQLPLDGSLQLGNLVPKRDYIHADDVADGLIALLESGDEGGDFNIGTGETYSAGDLVATIAEILGTTIEIDSVPERQRAGDRPNLRADAARLGGLGWKCRFDLREALTDTLRSYGKLS